MPETDYIVVLVTAPVDKGPDIARHVVDARLAACANIVPEVRSIYRWQGRIEDDRECLLVMKTERSAFDALAAAIRSVHPYSVPEIIAVPITAGSSSYLDWIAAVRRGEH
jgi:periplasmic divalent cation tolerance protein